MKAAKITSIAFISAFVLLAASAVGDGTPIESTSDRVTMERTAPDADGGFIYGRVTLEEGTVYEGRLRFGGTEEASWGDQFNGFRDQNPWVKYLPDGRLTERQPIEVFGFRIAHVTRRVGVGRPFMGRFGDIARIDAEGREIWVTLKSGTVFNLDRYSADDLADGLRIWDARHGVVDLDEWVIRRIEFFPGKPVDDTPGHLHGTVRTRHGTFSGFIQWNREKGVGSDMLNGQTGGADISLRFDTIRSISPAAQGARVSLTDGREIMLGGTPEAGEGNRGAYVDDERYGRVLVSWQAMEHVEFTDGGPGPAYWDFPRGHALTGTVVTRTGQRFAGRLVFDLDESETTETLDAPANGVNYTIPFGLVASIHLPDPDAPQARVVLHSKEELALDRSGDLGEQNAGMLVFVDGRGQPEYLRWSEIERVAFDRPQAMYPPIRVR